MIQIIDNFLSEENAEKLRDSAIAGGIGTWRPPSSEVGSGKYDGMSFVADHALAVHALTAHLGKPILPNLMFVRLTQKDTEKAYVHSDREHGSFTSIIYLSEHPGKESGTGFYRHRATNMTRMPSFAEMKERPEFFERIKREMVEGDESVWELVDFCSGAFGKALIFDAPLFHARHPKNGFGDTAEEARIVHVVHFNIINPLNGGIL